MSGPGPVPSLWMTPRLMRLRGVLAVCAGLDAVLLAVVGGFLLAPAPTTDLLLALLDWTGGALVLPSSPGFTTLALAVTLLWVAFALAAWANPRRFVSAARHYGDSHLLAALCGTVVILLETPLDLAAWACVFEGAMVSSLVRWRWKAAALPLLRERDAELRRGSGWTFDRLAGAPGELLDVVLARGLGPTAGDLCGIEYRGLRLHPVAALARRSRTLLGFFDAPGGGGAEGYHLRAHEGSPEAPFSAPANVGPNARRGFFVVRESHDGESLPYALVLDGPASRRNLDGDPAGRLLVRLVMPQSGDPRLMLGRVWLCLGPLRLPAGHLVLKAWRRHQYEGEEPRA